MRHYAVIIFTYILLMSIALTGCSEVSENSVDPSITPTEAIDDGQNTEDVVTITNAPNDKVINVYSNYDDVPKLIEKFTELHPDFPYEIKFFMYATVDYSYEVALNERIDTGDEVQPDIYCIESVDIMRYTQGDYAHYACPFQELGIDVDQLIEEAEIAQYAVDMGTNPEGKLVGLTYMGTGGAFIYRRSIAKDVWGTDEPEAIKDIIGPGWDKFFKAAADLKAKGYGIVSSEGDLWRPIENSANQPWIVDGKLYIDPKRESFLDLAKQLKDKGYCNNVLDWSNEWFDDMKEAGPKPIFGYFGPSWLINYIMIDNCGGEKPGEGTYGDWAVCEPTEGSFWHSNWVLANKNSKHKDAIGEIIQWLTLESSDMGLQYNYANGMLYSDITMDAVTSGIVMKKSIGKLDFLGGQDIFDIYYRAGKLVNGNNRTQFDESINYHWLEQAREYTAGNKTREQAIADFKQNVKINLDIVVE